MKRALNNYSRYHCHYHSPHRATTFLEREELSNEDRENFTCSVANLKMEILEQI